MQKVTFYTLLDKDIAIPIIQRDYVQGRTDEASNKIRYKFIEDLRKSLTKEDVPLGLDFIYSATSTDNSCIPIDGQQRLTTLFLLHWYIANKNRHDASEILNKFSYRVRNSSTDFCKGLSKSYNISISDKLSENICAQPWFFLSWKKDPTVRAMLVMLDEINKQFSDISILWEELVDDKNPCVYFEYLSLDEYTMSDELYIRMNARGKALDKFEILKANFIKFLMDNYAQSQITLNSTNITYSAYFSLQADTKWADFFWDKESPNNSSMLFYYFFLFVTKMLCHKNTVKYDKDSFDVYKNENSVLFLFKILDIISNSNKDNLNILFGKIEEKIPLFDFKCIFDDCLEDNKLTFGQQLIVFSILYLIYLEKSVNLSEESFIKLRIVRNLLLDAKNGGLRQEAMSSQVNYIINEILEKVSLQGNIQGSILRLTAEQRKEELDKYLFLQNHPEFRSDFHKAEDHPYFIGSIKFLYDLLLQDEIPNLERFCAYRDRAINIFSEEMLAKPYYTYRALILEFGLNSLDYGNIFYWEKDDIVWRRVFRLFDSDKKSIINQFLEKYHSKEDIKMKIDSITPIFSDWRTFVASDYRFLHYGSTGNIKADVSGIYKLNGIKMSSYHVELYSYYYYNKFNDNQKFKQFNIGYEYSKSYSRPYLWFQYQKSWWLEVYIYSSRCEVRLDSYGDSTNSKQYKDIVPEFKLPFSSTNDEGYYCKTFSNPDEVFKFIEQIDNLLQR